MVKIWEGFDDKNLSKSSSWITYKLFLKVMKIRDSLSIILKKIFPNKFGHYKTNHKFPPLDKNDINERISKLQKIIGINQKIECNFLSDRTILIKRS